MSDREDIQVIDAVLSGKTESFTRIIEKYQNMVFRYVYNRFNDMDEAQDMTQEIFIMALEALPSFRRESKFSTWLYSIMVNYCRNYFKKKRRQQTFSLNLVKGEDEYQIDLPDSRETPEDDVVADDSLRIMKDELARLPEDYRDILVLRDIDGLSYNEISEILGIQLSNVKVRIHRGREMLKKRLHLRGLV